MRTRVASNLSPWLSRCEVGDIHTVAISHGEGRFVVSDEVIAQMKAAGQIATQYVDAAGEPSMALGANRMVRCSPSRASRAPTAASWARWAMPSVAATTCTATCPSHVPGDKFMPIFESGVAYFA